MSLIDATHFFNEFSIGQGDFAPVAAKINEYIQTYEPEYIEAVLGCNFAGLFNSQISDTRFTALKDRLIKAPSPIAAYVFFNYQSDRSLQPTAGADAKIKVENASESVNTYRRVKAWNIMVEKSLSLVHWLDRERDVYPEFDIRKVDGSFFIKTNSFGI